MEWNSRLCPSKIGDQKLSLHKLRLLDTKLFPSSILIKDKVCTKIN